MPEIQIAQIQCCMCKSHIIWTEHVAIRLRERSIKRNDLMECVLKGQIIEQYPDDTPYPSCLILGKCKAGEPLHVVVGLNLGVSCCMITVYRPNLDKWEKDFKTRKGAK